MYCVHTRQGAAKSWARRGLEHLSLGRHYIPLTSNPRCTLQYALHMEWVGSHQTPDELIQSQLEKLILDTGTAFVLDGGQGVLDHYATQLALF